MSSITLKFKDGTTKAFPHEGRAGGSYTKRLDYKPGFVVITDEWDKKYSFPAEDIAEIEEDPGRRW